MSDPIGESAAKIKALKDAIDTFEERYPNVDDETKTMVKTSLNTRFQQLCNQHETLVKEEKRKTDERRQGQAEELYHQLVLHLREEHYIVDLNDEQDEALANFCRLVY
jgi:hypothetical protein